MSQAVIQIHDAVYCRSKAEEPMAEEISFMKPNTKKAALLDGLHAVEASGNPADCCGLEGLVP
jgi:hypothetical protein